MVETGVLKKPTFTVIGAGPGGLATAAHLAMNGYPVNLFNRSPERLVSILQKGGISVSGVISGFARLDLVTTSMQQAVSGADIVIVVLPANAHHEIGLLLSRYLSEGQIVLLTPGRTGGAIEIANIIKETAHVLVTVAETQTILYTCRKGEDTDVNILAIKNAVMFSALPATENKRISVLLKGIFPQYMPTSDVLETGLNNIGCILHPTPTLLNIGWIENPKARFKYYYEAITPSVAAILEALDSEREAVMARLGVRYISTMTWLGECYGAKGDNLYDTIQNNRFYESIEAPKSIQHRYIFEDVPTGLVPISSLGDYLGIKTPVIDTIIDLASVACKTDFRRFGRTMRSLNLDRFKPEELRHFVRKGER
jgi:opine dehydrogenase